MSQCKTIVLVMVAIALIATVITGGAAWLDDYIHHRAMILHAPPAYLPNLILTPGMVKDGWTLADTEQAGGTQDERHVTEAMRVAVWTRYGYDTTIGPYRDHANEYEIDHLVPVCLGGSSTLKNLWPQPYAGKWGAKVKDRLEVHIRAQVIAGKMSLSAGQFAFVPDWTKTYRAQGLPMNGDDGVPLEPEKTEKERE